MLESKLVGLGLWAALNSPSVFMLALPLLFMVLFGDESERSALLDVVLLMVFVFMFVLLTTGKQPVGTLLVCAGPLVRSVMEEVVSMLFTKSKLLMNLALIIVSKCDKSSRYCWSSGCHAGMSSTSSVPSSSIAISPEILFSLGKILSENLVSR